MRRRRRRRARGRAALPSGPARRGPPRPSGRAPRPHPVHAARQEEPGALPARGRGAEGQLHRRPAPRPRPADHERRDGAGDLVSPRRVERSRCVPPSSTATERRADPARPRRVRGQGQEPMPHSGIKRSFDRTSMGVCLRPGTRAPSSGAAGRGRVRRRYLRTMAASQAGRSPAQLITYLLEPQELADRHRPGHRRARRRAGGPWLGAASRAVHRGAAHAVHRLYRGIRHGRWDDRNVGARRPRLIVLAFITTSVAAGLILLIVGGAPALLTGYLALMLASVALLAVITTVWKISIHCAVASGSVAVLALTYGPLVLFGYLLVALLGWSRVTLGDHSTAQVVGGTVLGALAAGLAYAALVRLFNRPVALPPVPVRAAAAAMWRGRTGPPSAAISPARRPRSAPLARPARRRGSARRRTTRRGQTSPRPRPRPRRAGAPRAPRPAPPGPGRPSGQPDEPNRGPQDVLDRVGVPCGSGFAATSMPAAAPVNRIAARPAERAAGQPR